MSIVFILDHLLGCKAEVVDLPPGAALEQRSTALESLLPPRCPGTDGAPAEAPGTAEPPGAAEVPGAAEAPGAADAGAGAGAGHRRPGRPGRALLGTCLWTTGH